MSSPSPSAQRSYRTTHNIELDRLNLQIKQELLEMKLLYLTAPAIMGRLPPNYVRLKKQLKALKKNYAPDFASGMMYHQGLTRLLSQVDFEVDTLKSYPRVTN
jgi:hypothetical protein